MAELTPTPDPADLWLESWRKAVAGDREAWNRFLNDTRTFLRAVVQQALPGQGRGNPDPSDVVQDLVATRLLRCPQFLGTTGAEFRAWLREMTCNLAWNSLRHDKTQRRGGGRVHRSLSEGARDGEEPAAKDSTASQKAMRQEQRQKVQLVLDGLSPDHRQVLVLHWFEDLPLADVARRMGKSEEAIKQLHWRARKEFKIAMGSST